MASQTACAFCMKAAMCELPSQLELPQAWCRAARKRPIRQKLRMSTANTLNILHATVEWTVCNPKEGGSRTSDILFWIRGVLSASFDCQTTMATAQATHRFQPWSALSSGCLPKKRSRRRLVYMERSRSHVPSDVNSASPSSPPFLKRTTPARLME